MSKVYLPTPEELAEKKRFFKRKHLEEMKDRAGPARKPKRTPRVVTIRLSRGKLE